MGKLQYSKNLYVIVDDNYTNIINSVIWYNEIDDTIANGMYYSDYTDQNVIYTIYNGQLHNENGPAVFNKTINMFNKKTKDYYYKNELIDASNDEDFKNKIKLLILY